MPDTVISTTPASAGDGDIRGNVYGGRQPVSGAAIYMYGAPKCSVGTGYGTCVGVSLLGNKTSSLSPNGQCDASVVAPLYYDGTNCYYKTGDGTGSVGVGEFNLTGLYQCNVSTTAPPYTAQAGQQVWLYSIGGSPGVTAGAAGVNPSAGFTAALGTCPTTNSFSASSFIYINEVSTIAFAYGVAGFATDARHVSAPPANYAPNLVNAFNNSAQLYDIYGGTDPGDHGARHMTPSGNGTTPYLLINTLADVIANCINSQNTGAPSANGQSAACISLFTDQYGSASYPITGSSAAETASTAIYMAQNPWNNSFFSVASSESPWVPNYNTAGLNTPFDLTAAITFSGVASPYGIAIDTKGDAYVAKSTASTGAIVELSPLGAVTATSGTLAGPSGVTIDSTGNVWTSGQTASGAVYKLPASLNTTTAYAPTISNQPHQIAADGSGFVYIADAGNNQVVSINKSGTIKYISDNTAAKLSCTTAATAIAFAAGSPSLWVAGNGTTDDVCNIPTAAGTPNSGQSLGSQGLGIAVDSTGNAWVTTTSGQQLFKVTASGKTPYTGGGLTNGGAVAIDGGNNVWIVNGSAFDSTSTTIGNGTAPTLVEFDTTSGTFVTSAPVRGSKASGYQYGSLSFPTAIAIDGSGDVWVTNNNGTYSNMVTELIGAAVPVKTPVFQGGGVPNVKAASSDEE